MDWIWPTLWLPVENPCLPEELKLMHTYLNLLFTASLVCISIFVSVNAKCLWAVLCPTPTLFYSKTGSFHGSAICRRASIWQQYEWKCYLTLPNVVWFLLFKTTDLAIGECNILIFSTVSSRLSVQRANSMNRVDCSHNQPGLHIAWTISYTLLQIRTH